MLNVVKGLRILKALIFRKFLVRKIAGIREYYQINPKACAILGSENATLYYTPTCFDISVLPDTLLPVPGFEIFNVIFNNTGIIGGSDFIVPDKKYAIHETARHFRENKNIAVNDGGALISSAKNCILNPIEEVQKIDEGIFLAGNYSYNYFHFLIEIIPRFKYIDRFVKNKSVPLLIDVVCLKIAQFRELVEIFNTEKRPIIPIDAKKFYTIRKLHYTSAIHYFPPNFKVLHRIKPTDCLFQLQALSFIREKCLCIANNSETPTKLFLCRKNAGTSRSYNEEEIFAAVAPFGFTQFYPERYSVTEQISFFKNADMIIGATGAAFTNILFCQNTCKIICLTNYKLSIAAFSGLASFAGTRLNLIADNSLSLISGEKMHADFHIEPADVVKAIHTLMSSSPTTA